MGTSWAQAIDHNLRDPFGLEAYWKTLLLPNLWLTPGVQAVSDPSLNPAADNVVIGQIKARLFF